MRHPLTTDDRDPQEVTRSGEEVEFWPRTTDGLSLLQDRDDVRAVNLFIRKHHSNVPIKGRGARLIQLDRLYYAEANIPTSIVTEDDLNPIVTNNLVRLARLGRLPEGIPTTRLAAALIFMRERLYYSAPRTWRRAMLEQFGLTHQEYFPLFHYGVFNRQLRVDLALPVCFDHVHRAERINYPAEFANRFLEPMR